MKFSIKERTIENESGFSLMEVLVASSLGALVIALVVANILTNHSVYFEDIKRTSINSNLRASMDIMSMNIRQAGENLSDNFPTIVIEDGGSDEDAVLTLRRSPLQEAITVCSTINIGGNKLTTWTSSSSTPACLQANAFPLVQTVMSAYTSLNGEVEGYIYNSITKKGEFTTIQLDPDEQFLKIKNVTNQYDPLVSHLYLLEEMSFSMAPATKTLNLYRNGDYANPNTVAFDITKFNARIEYLNGTTDTDYDSTGSDPNWKNIDQIEITLGGEKQVKTRTIESSISAKFFPRNILSN